MSEDASWEVEVKGDKCGESFEISVIRKNNVHGHLSRGWFDKDKLLISHNGGPCHWPLIEPVWDRMIILAEEVAAELNDGTGQRRRAG